MVLIQWIFNLPLLQNGNNKKPSNLSKTFLNGLKITITWVQSKLQRTHELVAEVFLSIYVIFFWRGFHDTINQMAVISGFQCYPTGQVVSGNLS